MSLAADIAKRMLARRKQAASAKAPPKPAVRPQKRPDAQAAQSGPLPKFEPGPVHPGKCSMLDPPPSPPERVPMAERRRRITEGVARRNAPVPPEPKAPYITPPPLPAVPPRPELDLAKGLEALPLPSSSGPDRLPPNPATGFRGSCKAINADTGKQCALLVGHTTAHRHGQTAFFRIATPNQKSFTRRELIDSAATRSTPEAQ